MDISETWFSTFLWCEHEIFFLNYQKKYIWIFQVFSFSEPKKRKNIVRSNYSNAEKATNETISFK